MSVFQMIDLHDVISICPSNDPRHSVVFEGVSVPEENTCTAVLDALTGRLSHYWQVTIKKNIPSGAGLGGGSSNAAVLLMALNQLESLGLVGDELRQIARGIGSDVSFFLHGGQAKVMGTGDQILSNQSLIECGFFVLVLPAIHCSTSEVYHMLDEVGAFDDLETLSGEQTMTMGYNRLVKAAFQLMPDLARLHQQLMASLDVPIHMSGSGSTLYIPCISALKQREVYDQLMQLTFNCPVKIKAANAVNGTEWSAETGTEGRT